MTEDEAKAWAVKMLTDIRDNDKYDPEWAHGEADDVLCELLRALGCAEVVRLFHEIDKWYA